MPMSALITVNKRYVVRLKTTMATSADRLYFFRVDAAFSEDVEANKVSQEIGWRSLCFA